jgi:hypothetical protein
MTPAIDMDGILKTGGWSNWRSVLNDSSLLAEAARLWCASSYWHDHTPLLEDWKTVAADLRPGGLTEEALLRISSSGERGLPFPAIPLFENEQVCDLCSALLDIDAAAALAERLAAHVGFLTFDPSESKKYCWEHLSPAIKAGVGYEMWLWMFSDCPPPPALPSMQEVEVLKRANSPRRSAAIRRLEALIEPGPGSPYSAEALAGLAAALLPAPLKPPQSAPEAEEHEPAGEYPRLVNKLFDRDFDESEWSTIQAIAAARAPQSSAPHPLVAMTKYLREYDPPIAQDREGWTNLRRVFLQYPDLLGVDPAEPRAPLPALQLACSMHTTETPGLLALALLPLARQYRHDPAWWRSLLEALRPAERRGGWRNANDRWEIAIRTVKCGAGGLTEAERNVMAAGLALESEENIHG